MTWTGTPGTGPLTLDDKLAIAHGTIAAAAETLGMTVTWNNVAVTFTAIKLNVTDTFSAALSLLIDLQVGGNTKFSVDKSGNIKIAGLGDASAPTFVPTGDPDTGLFWTGANVLGITAGGTERARFITAGSGLQLQADPAAALQAATKQYVDGIASIVLDRVTADTIVANDATEQTVYTFSVTGGTLSTNRTLRLTMIAEYFNNSGASRNLTVKAKYGATTAGTRIFSTITANAARRIFEMRFLLMADGATNAQNGLLQSSLGDTGTILGGDGGIVTNALSGHTTVAEDSTAAKSLVVTIQHSFADPNLEFKMESAVLEKL